MEKCEKFKKFHELKAMDGATYTWAAFAARLAGEVLVLASRASVIHARARRAIISSRARVVGRGTGRTIVPLKEERLA